MLFISFMVHLENYEMAEVDRPKGPLFHRWLPDGRSDAILIPTVDKRNRLEIWFERRGFMRDNFVRYDNQRQEVDPHVMRLQGKLEAGQLRGEVQYANVTNLEMQSLRENHQGNQEYVALAKRVVYFLHPPLSNFVDILRFQYGQYWIPELRSWDSRTQSLGGYCAHTLYLRWREDPKKPWQQFCPDEPSQTFAAQPLPGRAYGEYLTEVDWRHLQETFDPKSTLPLAIRLIGKANELSDAGHIQEAFVQAVTGVELAIEHFLTTRSAGLTKYTKSSALQFTTVSLKTQVFILASALSNIPSNTIENALKAIDIRNAIVHEGKQPEDSGREMLFALFKCAGVFLGLDELKTPVICHCNSLTPPDYEGRQGIVIGSL